MDDRLVDYNIYDLQATIDVRSYRKRLVLLYNDSKYLFPRGPREAEFLPKLSHTLNDLIIEFNQIFNPKIVKKLGR